MIFLIVVVNGYALETLICASAQNHDLCVPLKGIKCFFDMYTKFIIVCSISEHKHFRKNGTGNNVGTSSSFKDISAIA